MKKWAILTVFLFSFSCSHQTDRSLSSISEDTPDVPEDYRISCLNKGGDLHEGDCRCVKDSKFIDPYQEECAK